MHYKEDTKLKGLTCLSCQPQLFSLMLIFVDDQVRAEEGKPMGYLLVPEATFYQSMTAVYSGLQNTKQDSVNSIKSCHENVQALKGARTNFLHILEWSFNNKVFKRFVQIKITPRFVCLYESVTYKPIFKLCDSWRWGFQQNLFYLNFSNCHFHIIDVRTALV